MKEETVDVILSAQFSAKFDDKGFTHKEQVYSYCINEIILSANDILSQFHEYAFKDVIDAESEIKEPTFETIETDLQDIAGYLFCILNNLKIDALPYSEIMEIKNDIPMLSRTDRILTTLAIIQTVSDISGMIWQELDYGNKRIVQKDLEEPPSETVPSIEDDILSASGLVLALVDTLCQHMGKSLRSVL